MTVKLQENCDRHGVLQSAYKYGAYLFLIYIENFQVITETEKNSNL